MSHIFKHINALALHLVKMVKTYSANLNQWRDVESFQWNMVSKGYEVSYFEPDIIQATIMRKDESAYRGGEPRKKE